MILYYYKYTTPSGGCVHYWQSAQRTPTKLPLSSGPGAGMPRQTARTTAIIL